MEEMMQKILLVIAFHYPPINASASKRLAGLTKHLPHSGWQPVVVTRLPSSSEILDNDFVAGLDKVVRYPLDYGHADSINPVLRRARTLLFPCKTPYTWYQQLRTEIEAIIRKFQPNAILASSPPEGSLSVVSEVCSRQNIPWIADFRDTPAQEYLIGNLPPSWIFFNLRRVIANASATITVSEGLAQILNSRLGITPYVIPSGYDDEEASIKPSVHARDSHFRIVFTGRIIKGHRDPAPLLIAIQSLIAQDYIKESDIEVIFYGDPNFYDSSTVDYLQSFGNFCKYAGNLTRQGALNEQRTATILLQLSHPKERGVVTGKIFEYLAARRPVLCVPSDHGEIDALLSRTGAGRSASTPEQIETVLRAWIDEWRVMGHLPFAGKDHSIAPYAFSNIARQLATILNRVSDDHHSK